MTAVREPAVAGSFYPADARQLRALVHILLDEAGARSPGTGRPMGLLVPHAGLAYSGLVAAAGWRLLAAPGAVHDTLTVIVLGTNHADPWLDGVGVWPSGGWRTPLGIVDVDATLAAEIAGLGPPFLAGPAGSLDEHSIEVQLPFLQLVAPGARVVPLAVAAGRGSAARDAGVALGRLLAPSIASGRAVVAISSDMAHYPAASVARRVTDALLPALSALDAAGLAAAEASVSAWQEPGIACGMCGVQPAILGLAALAAAGATRGVPLLTATSADAGGPSGRTVGYLAMRLDH